MKYFLLVLMFFTMHVFAADKVDAAHPYYGITTSADGTMSVLIGAYDSYAPRLLEDGVVVFQELLVSHVSFNGYPAGYKVEMLTLVNCELQIYKSITIASRRTKYDEPVMNFPGTGTDQEEAISRAFKEVSTRQVIPDSLRAAAVDAACNYVESQNKKSVPNTYKINL